MANLIRRACACQRGGIEISICPCQRARERVPPCEKTRSRDGCLGKMLGRLNSLRMLNHVIDRCRKIINSRAGHDDCVAATMRFLRNTKEFAAIVFAELDVEMLAFDLQLPGLYEVIHSYEKNCGV